MKSFSFPDRRFKIWDYLVSHQQLIVRSPGPDQGSPNLDLHFTGVMFVRAPVAFQGLAVLAPTLAEAEEMQALLAPAKCELEWVHILESGGRRYVIVAASLSISETDYPMMSTALIHPQ